MMGAIGLRSVHQHQMRNGLFSTLKLLVTRLVESSMGNRGEIDCRDFQLHIDIAPRHCMI